MKIELNSLGCCSKLQQRQARSILFSFSILIRFDKKYISTCGLNIFLKISPLERYISFAYRLNWYTSLEEIFFKVDRQHDILEKTCIRIVLRLNVFTLYVSVQVGSFLRAVITITAHPNITKLVHLWSDFMGNI